MTCFGGANPSSARGPTGCPPLLEHELSPPAVGGERAQLSRAHGSRGDDGAASPCFTSISFHSHIHLHPLLPDKLKREPGLDKASQGHMLTAHADLTLHVRSAKIKDGALPSGNEEGAQPSQAETTFFPSHTHTHTHTHTKLSFSNSFS